MQVKTGIDIIHLPTFAASMERSGEPFLRRVFSVGELQRDSVEHIAGLFALKEAVIKALGLQAGSWHTIVVRHTQEGKPIVFVSDEMYDACDVSIAHHQEYACATVVFLYE